MDTAGFYKLDPGGDILYGPNFVYGPYGSFNLYRDEHDTYTYPIDGWYWFDTKEEAYTFFGVPLPEQPITE